MASPNIKRPKNLSDYHVDEIIKAAKAALRDCREGFAADVAELVEKSRFNNEAADDFFQALVITMGFFDDQAGARGLDIFGTGRNAEKEFNTAFDNSFAAALAYVAIGDDYIMNHCTRKERDAIEDNTAAYKDLKKEVQSLVRYDPDDGDDDRRDDRRDSRRDRDDRDSRRDRGGREERRPRSRRGGEESMYSHRSRNSVREERPTRDRGGRDSGRSERGGERATQPIRAYLGNPNRMPVVKGAAMPSLMKNSVAGVLAVEMTSDGVVNHVYDKENNVEPYAQHELRAFLNASSDGIIVPTVDFRITPELVDSAAVSSNKNVFISDDTMSFARHGWCNINIQSVMANNVDKSAPMLVQNIAQQRDMVVTRQVYDRIVSNRPASFDEWHKILSACRAELIRANATVAAGDETFTPSDIERMIYTIGRLEDDLLFLLIQFMSIVLPSTANFTTGSFLSAWPNLAEAIRGWVSDEEHMYHDCGNDFYRLEQNYLASNYRVSDISIADDAVTGMVMVESKSICVYYRGAVFNLDTCLDAYGQYFQIEHKNLPELFAACTRLLRYRNSRHGLANVYIFDSTGTRLILTGGDLDGGRCCMVRPKDEDQPFTVV